MSNDTSRAGLYRWPLGLIGVIFVGAISNGLWEFFLRDFVNFVFGKLASGFGSIFSSYLNYLHEDIGKAFSNEMVALLFLIVISFIVIANIGLILYAVFLRLPGDRPLTSRKIPSKLTFRDKRFIAILVMTLFNVIAYSEIALSASYRMKATNWVEQTLDILHPVISEKQFVQLRADFRSISSASAFYELHSKLTRLGETNKILLPPFEPIGASIK